MGSNFKSSYGGGNNGKCGCNSKRLKKAQRVPQRGPGVAELEKILSDQKHDQMKPPYGPAVPGPPSMYQQPPLPPPYHPLRPPQLQHQPIIDPPPAAIQASHFPPHYVGFSNSMVRPDQVQVNAMIDSGMSFTQMIMMSDAHDSTKPNAHPMFHPNYAMKRPLAEMPSNPHPFYAQQLGQPGVETGKAPMLSEQEAMMLRGMNAPDSFRTQNMKSLDGNILSLGPSSLTERTTMKPISPESDSSSESRVLEDQRLELKPNDPSERTHPTQIFGFKLQTKELSMDETRLSLNHNAPPAEVPSLDLNLKL
uniref:Uncharacterized protein n=1 Tax=Kalanchoe fedtschenkoi TaxID=63787 RepID=A0A7N0UI73_KALFE